MNLSKIIVLKFVGVLSKHDSSEIIDIFTCEDIISSHVKISYPFHQFVTIRYTTDFYIIIIYVTP